MGELIRKLMMCVWRLAVLAGCTSFPAAPISGGGMLCLGVLYFLGKGTDMCKDDNVCRGRCLGALNNTFGAARSSFNSTAAGGLS